MSKDNKDATDTDEVLDARIDEMLADFEKAGKAYDQCGKAMQLAIDRAREPLTIAQWIEAAKLDQAGRRKYSDDLFEPEAVKTVVVDLLKKKNVIRLGRQTFCSHVVVGEMGTAIDNVLLWHCCVCDLEGIADLLLDYEDCHAILPMPNKKPWLNPKKQLATSPKTNAKMKSFVEEKIVLLALDELESVIKHDDQYFHITTPETCANYVKGAIDGRAIKDMSTLDFFDMVLRVHFTGMDNQFEGRRVKDVKDALGDDIIRRIVLSALEKEKVIVVNGDRVTPYKKPDKYLWLDD